MKSTASFGHLEGALHRLVTGRQPAGPVAVARIAVGLAATARVADAAFVLPRLTTAEVFLTPYVPWSPAPTRPLVLGLLITWGVAGVLFTIGWRTKLAGSLLAGAVTGALLLDQQTYSNHVYLLALVVGLLTVADAGAAWSLDSRREPRASVPAWPVFLLQAQTSLVYAFAALSKLTPDYLSGLALAPFVQLKAGVALIGLPAMATIVLLLSWAAIPAELVLAACLWSPRRRVGAALLGVVLHLGMVAAIYRMRFDLAVFAVMMWGLYFLFVGPDLLASRERWMAHAVKPKPSPTDVNPQATG